MSLEAKKSTLIQEWEAQTGQRWPRYTADDIKNGRGSKRSRVGQPFEAHHIRLLNDGGKNAWCNITPLTREYHRGAPAGIHRSGGIFRVCANFSRKEVLRMASEFDDLIVWYQQYREGISDEDPLRAINYFKPIEMGSFDDLQRKRSAILPNSLKIFLAEVGAGRFGGSSVQEFEVDENFFLSPEEIDEILDKSNPVWNIDPDLFAENDVPFFEYEAALYFVFRVKDGSDDSVWLPHGYKKISNSFYEFLLSLKDNPIFYQGALEEFVEDEN